LDNPAKYTSKSDEEAIMPEMLLTIRRPSYEELVNVRAMRRQELLGEMVDPATLEIDPIDLAEKVIHVVAFAPDGDILSCVRLKPIADDETVYEVSRMVTRTRHRGQGIGTKVLSAAEELAVRDGAKGFVLDSRPSARNFYARAGYWPTGRQKVLENGDINYVMVKQVVDDK
jgi:predicted GNAT family N-acyltransferase